MSRKYNLYIEGLQGSGKSTLTNRLGEALPDYTVYREGDISPVELAWCAYMTRAEYEAALAAWPDFADAMRAYTQPEDSHFITAYTRIHTDKREFYQYMERYEIYSGRKTPDEFCETVLGRFKNYHGSGNIFECSFFQNTIEELMLFADCSDELIIDFYGKLVNSIDIDGTYVIRLITSDIEATLRQIKAERVDESGNEAWYQLMMTYLRESPRGKAHGYSTFDDLVAHFKRRITLENAIIDKYLQGHYIQLESKNYDLAQVLDIIAK